MMGEAQPTEAQLQAAHEANMRMLVDTIDRIFNGTKYGSDRHTGFVMLVFPFGEKGGKCSYLSNGADRGQVAKMLEAQVRRMKDQQREERRRAQ